MKYETKKNKKLKLINIHEKNCLYGSIPPVGMPGSCNELCSSGSIHL